MNNNGGSSSRSAAAKKTSTKKSVPTGQSSLLRFGQFIEKSTVGGKVVSKSTSQPDPDAKVPTSEIKGTAGAHKCNICDRSFSRPCALANHKKTHDKSVVKPRTIADALPADLTCNDYAAMVIASEEEYESFDDSSYDSYANSDASDDEMV